MIAYKWERDCNRVFEFSYQNETAHYFTGIQFLRDIIGRTYFSKPTRMYKHDVYKSASEALAAFKTSVEAKIHREYMVIGQVNKAIEENQ